jgi:hypothetical protein
MAVYSAIQVTARTADIKIYAISERNAAQGSYAEAHRLPKTNLEDVCTA